MAVEGGFDGGGLGDGLAHEPGGCA